MKGSGRRSRLYLDGPLLVEDDGLHGMVKKCGTKTVAAGDHVVYVEGFQAGGGVGMRVTYSGADTGGKEILLRSGAVPGKPGQYFAQCDPTAGGLDLSSFIVCIFHSDKGLSSTPSLGAADTAGSSLHYVGKGGMSVVDVKSTGDFRKAVAKTPDENYAWAIIGELKVKEAGAYNLCIESDDGCVAACRENRGL